VYTYFVPYVIRPPFDVVKPIVTQLGQTYIHECVVTLSEKVTSEAGIKRLKKAIERKTGYSESTITIISLFLLNEPRGRGVAE